MSNLINKAKAAMSKDKSDTSNDNDYVDNPQSSVSFTYSTSRSSMTDTDRMLALTNQT
jgi:hypothetical protein